MGGARVGVGAGAPLGAFQNLETDEAAFEVFCHTAMVRRFDRATFGAF